MGEAAENICAHHTETFTDTCTKVLKGVGARITQPRLAVIRCLEQAKKPLQPKDIIDNIESDDSLPKVDRVSVYRVIETLLEHHLVHQVAPTGGYVACTHSECSKQMHILTSCSGCGKIDEMHVPSEVMAPLRWFLQGERGFEPEENFLQVQGTCKACGNKIVRAK